MKRLFLSLMLLTLLSGVAVAKDSFSSLSEAQIKTLFCHKWKLTYLEFKGKKKEIPAKLPASLLIFLADGNLIEAKVLLQVKFKVPYPWFEVA